MNRQPRIFLAAPYSQWMDFDAGRVVPLWADRLERLRGALITAGASVFNAHHNERWGEEWLAPEVCTPADFTAMAECDAVCAIVGSPPSGGVAVELGWASAMGKPVLLVTSAARSPMIDGLGTLTRTEVLGEPPEWEEADLKTIADRTLLLAAASPKADPRASASLDAVAGLRVGLEDHVQFCFTASCRHEREPALREA